MATDETPQEQPNLPLVKPATISDQEMYMMHKRYGIAFEPPTVKEYQLCGIIKALEELVDDLGSGIKRS